MTFANDKAKAQADAATLAADLVKANADAATLAADLAALTPDPVVVPPTSAESPDGTVVSNTTGRITSASGKKFGLTAIPGKVLINEVVDNTSGGIVSLIYSGGKVIQAAYDGSFWIEPETGGPGIFTTNPIVVPSTGGDPTPTQSLLWTGAAGTFPTNVIPELGGNGWGNGELETYTNRAVNAHCDGAGNLIIVARPEKFTGADGITRNFTSARLNTTKSLQIQPGSYFECGAILPPNGWSAFWTIGVNALQGVPWPDNGEVDIVEVDAGHAKTNIHTTNNNQPGWGYPGSDTGPVDGKTRVKYGCYFDGTVIKFYRDRKLTSQWTAQQAALLGAKWPFNQPIYCIFNVAVSGGDTGFTGATATFGPVNAWKGTLPALIGG